MRLIKNMGLSTFNDISSLSKTEISEAIIETENQLFDLRFKKSTRQNFKLHEIKNAKRRLAQLKTLLTQRLRNEVLMDNLIKIMRDDSSN